MSPILWLIDVALWITGLYLLIFTMFFWWGVASLLAAALLLFVLAGKHGWIDDLSDFLSDLF